jgi:aspartate racemase
MDDLIAQGVQVVVLGCTELPLLLRGSTLGRPGGPAVRLVDPTDVLAKRCVAYALGESAAVDSGSAPGAWDSAFPARVSAI